MEASCNFELAVRYLYADLTALPATVNLGDPSRAKAGEKSRGTCVLPIIPEALPNQSPLYFSCVGARRLRL
jgi:hypothetical protein